MLASGRLVAVLFATSITTMAAPNRVSAQPFPPVTDNEYAIDLYEGSVIGSARIIAMGGASVALGSGSAATLANPAAPAVRSATSNDRWDWDWHFDTLASGPGRDLDNNGIRDDDSDDVTLDPVLTAGLTIQYKNSGYSLALLRNTRTVRSSTGASVDVVTNALLLSVAARLHHWDLTLGGAVQLSSFSVEAGEEVFSIEGTALRGGAVWAPAWANLRVGGQTTLPLSANDPADEPADPNTPPEMEAGYFLPGEVKIPWQVSTGFAYRFAPSAWNKPVKTRWRDERHLTLAADLIVTSGVKRGSGVEAFALGLRQRSGRDASVSFRVGGEIEAIPGWLRVRLGSYYEPSRFRDAANDRVAGRFHITSGIEGRLFAFRLFGRKFRVRLELAADIAPRFSRFAISPGFWY